MVRTLQSPPLVLLADMCPPPPPPSGFPAHPHPQITIQFDNRSNKVASPSVNQKVIRALADTVFRVPPAQVRLVGRMGQSSLFNHQSIVTYQAVGPTLNGKSPLVNCQVSRDGFDSCICSCGHRHRQQQCHGSCLNVGCVCM
jgi:hypothetical protein